MIFAIDPGTEQSGWVRYEGGRILDCGIDSNEQILLKLLDARITDDLAVETMQANYAATVGAHVIGTLIWIGRFQQQWHRPASVLLLSRQAIKQHVCGNVKANDAGVRQALIDKLGPPGTKKKPGPTYGVTSHAWSALAVAVTAQHQGAAA